MSEKRKLRWYQYSLRTLLLAVLLVSLAMSWFATKLERARRQREAVAVVHKHGGWVAYDYEFLGEGARSAQAKPPGPAVLRSILGADFFATVVGVYFIEDNSGPTDMTDNGLEHLACLDHLQELLIVNSRGVTDAGLVHVSSFPKLKRLDLFRAAISDAGIAALKGLANLEYLGLPYTDITDSGLHHLEPLRSLREIDLYGTQVTPEGIQKLQRSLPDCEIEY